jgi:hypothetical protein
VAGADVFAIGTPADKALAFSVSKGVVSGYPTVEERVFLQTDASINPGNSGGPILGADGTVAAIVSWKVADKDFEGLGFGVPVDVIEEKVRPPEVLGALVGGIEGSSPNKVQVTFESEGEGVTIAIAHDLKTSASTQYGNFALTHTDTEDSCIAPCTHTFKPGVYDLIAYGEKWEGHRTKVDLRKGETVQMKAMPRSSMAGRLGRGLAATGFTTAVIGGSLWGTAALLNASETASPGLTNAGIATTVIGGVMIGGGYGLLGATKPKWETTKE